MTIAALCLLILAAALRTRIGRLHLARWLLKGANALGAAGSRIVREVEREML